MNTKDKENQENFQKAIKWATEKFYELHEHPELSNKEFWTANYIIGVLKGLGIEAERVGKTGVVGLFRCGKRNTKTLMLRADMDAAPFGENAMHICGHDAHMAMILGVAKVLTETPKLLNCNIKFVFQPAEEIARGAKQMIKAGVLENVDAAFMPHVWPELTAGSVGTKEGIFWSSYTKLKAKFQSKEEGAQSKKENVILASSALIEQLNEIKDGNFALIIIGLKHEGKRNVFGNLLKVKVYSEDNHTAEPEKQTISPVLLAASKIVTELKEIFTACYIQQCDIKNKNAVSEHLRGYLSLNKMEVVGAIETSAQLEEIRGKIKKMISNEVKGVMCNLKSQKESMSIKTPSSCKISGMFRTHDVELSENINKKLTTIVKDIERQYNVAIDLNVETAVPLIYNDPGLTKIFNDAARKRGCVVSDNESLKWAGEDFAWYVKERIPAVLALIGCGDGKTLIPLHARGFHDEKVAEHAIPTGMNAILAFTKNYSRVLAKKPRLEE